MRRNFSSGRGAKERWRRVVKKWSFVEVAIQADLVKENASITSGCSRLISIIDQEVCPGALVLTHSAHEAGFTLTGALISSRRIEDGLIERTAMSVIILLASHTMKSPGLAFAKWWRTGF